MKRWKSVGFFVATIDKLTDKVNRLEEELRDIAYRKGTLETGAKGVLI